MYNEPDDGMQQDPLEVIRFLLETAITLGAPAYNHGDLRGCYEIYACTARLLLNTVKGAEETTEGLKEALEKSSIIQDVDQQAWILRLEFDSILKNGQDTEDAENEDDN